MLTAMADMVEIDEGTITVGDALLGEEFDADLGIAGHVASTGQPVLITDVSSERRWFKGIDEKTGFLRVQNRRLIQGFWQDIAAR